MENLKTEYAVKSPTTTKVLDLAITAMLVSLVFVATRFINIRLPISINGGLVHLGNVMLFTAAIVFGPKKGALAGGLGMSLFDIVSGWMPWAPFTFVIRAAMGFIVGYVANLGNANGRSTLKNGIGIILSAPILIGGYYLTEGFLYGNWIAPVTSIPGNVAQLVVGFVLALPLSLLLKKTKMFDNF